jgi:hypothetical protein
LDDACFNGGGADVQAKDGHVIGCGYTAAYARRTLGKLGTGKRRG